MLLKFNIVEINKNLNQQKTKEYNALVSTGI